LELARIEKERQLIAKMIASWAYRPTLQCEWHSIMRQPNTQWQIKNK
jgi:hypothetical protein